MKTVGDLNLRGKVECDNFKTSDNSEAKRTNQKGELVLFQNF